MTGPTPEQKRLRSHYFLTQILGASVLTGSKKIGTLSDVIIRENGKLPEVVSLYVSRPYGYESLQIPFDRVVELSSKKAVVEIENVDAYSKKAVEEDILLRDNILDKKVLDIEDREVEVVYDVKMSLQNNRLFVTAVDMSKFGLLRRMGLKWLADIIYKPHEKQNSEIVPWTFIQPLPTDISSFTGEVRLKVLKEKLSDLPAQDLADILEEMDREPRSIVFGQLDTEKASDALEEIDPNVQRELVSSLKQERVVQLINEMTPAQAADILSVLPFDQAQDILALLSPQDVPQIKAILEKQELNVANLATQDYIKLPPDMTVARAEEEYPKICKGKDFVMYLYITDDHGVLLGIVGLKDLLLADDSLTLRQIMDDNFVGLVPEQNLKETYKLFKRYGKQALPILDEAGRILGVVLSRDVLNLKFRFIE